MPVSVSLYLVGVMMFSMSSFSFAEGHDSQSKARPFIRPSSNPSLTGTIIVKPLDENNDALFFRMNLTDGSTKDYLVDENCNETCRKAIEACKGGEKCMIRGKVDESALSITPEFVKFDTAAAPIVETKPSKQADGTVVTWTRDRSHPKLGVAWRDPSGMIWGDMVTNADGTPKYMDHEDATDYCNRIGAKLPSKDDFIRLSEYMGAEPESDGKGYQPQVLPNLTYTAEGRVLSRYFWSSSDHPFFPTLAYYFDGSDGVLGSEVRYYVDLSSVRCVVSRR